MSDGVGALNQAAHAAYKKWAKKNKSAVEAVEIKAQSSESSMISPANQRLGYERFKAIMQQAEFKSKSSEQIVDHVYAEFIDKHLKQRFEACKKELDESKGFEEWWQGVNKKRRARLPRPNPNNNPNIDKLNKLLTVMRALKDPARWHGAQFENLLCPSVAKSQATWSVPVNPPFGHEEVWIPEYFAVYLWAAMQDNGFDSTLFSGVENPNNKYMQDCSVDHAINIIQETVQAHPEYGVTANRPDQPSCAPGTFGRITADIAKFSHRGVKQAGKTAAQQIDMSGVPNAMRDIMVQQLIDKDIFSGVVDEYYKTIMGDETKLASCKQAYDHLNDDKLFSDIVKALKTRCQEIKWLLDKTEVVAALKQPIMQVWRDQIAFFNPWGKLFMNPRMSEKLQIEGYRHQVDKQYQKDFEFDEEKFQQFLNKQSNTIASYKQQYFLRQQRMKVHPEFHDANKVAAAELAIKQASEQVTGMTDRLKRLIEAGREQVGKRLQEEEGLQAARLKHKDAREIQMINGMVEKFQQEVASQTLERAEEVELNRPLVIKTTHGVCQLAEYCYALYEAANRVNASYHEAKAKGEDAEVTKINNSIYNYRHEFNKVLAFVQQSLVNSSTDTTAPPHPIYSLFVNTFLRKIYADIYTKNVVLLQDNELHFKEWFLDSTNLNDLSKNDRVACQAAIDSIHKAWEAHDNLMPQSEQKTEQKDAFDLQDTAAHRQELMQAIALDFPAEGKASNAVDGDMQSMVRDENVLDFSNFLETKDQEESKKIFDANMTSLRQGSEILAKKYNQLIEKGATPEQATIAVGNVLMSMMLKSLGASQMSYVNQAGLYFLMKNYLYFSRDQSEYLRKRYGLAPEFEHVFCSNSSDDPLSEFPIKERMFALMLHLAKTTTFIKPAKDLFEQGGIVVCDRRWAAQVLKDRHKTLKENDVIYRLSFTQADKLSFAKAKKNNQGKMGYGLGVIGGSQAYKKTQKINAWNKTVDCTFSRLNMGVIDHSARNLTLPSGSVETPQPAALESLARPKPKANGEDNGAVNSLYMVLNPKPQVEEFVKASQGHESKPQSNRNAETESRKNDQALPETDPFHVDANDDEHLNAAPITGAHPSEESTITLHGQTIDRGRLADLLNSNAIQHFEIWNYGTDAEPNNYYCLECESEKKRDEIMRDLSDMGVPVHVPELPNPNSLVMLNLPYDAQVIHDFLVATCPRKFNDYDGTENKQHSGLSAEPDDTVSDNSTPARSISSDIQELQGTASIKQKELEKGRPAGWVQVLPSPHSKLPQQQFGRDAEKTFDVLSSGMRFTPTSSGDRDRAPPVEQKIEALLTLIKEKLNRRSLHGRDEAYTQVYQQANHLLEEIGDQPKYQPLQQPLRNMVKRLSDNMSYDANNPTFQASIWDAIGQFLLACIGLHSRATKIRGLAKDVQQEFNQARREDGPSQGPTAPGG